MFHQDKSTGHCEVNAILKGDYLGTSHRVHITSNQGWATFRG